MGFQCHRGCKGKDIWVVGISIVFKAYGNLAY